MKVVIDGVQVEGNPEDLVKLIKAMVEKPEPSWQPEHPWIWPHHETTYPGWRRYPDYVQTFI
jgi:hypothetical protein